MSQNLSVRPGFIPTGTGPKGATFGRDPATGRAYKRDGSVRAERKSFSPEEKVARIQVAHDKAMGSVGRTVLKTVPSLATFRNVVGTFRRWLNDCESYGTAEALAERRAYHQRMLDTAEAKHQAAVRWLPGAQKAKNAIAALYANAGAAWAEFRKANGRVPTPEEADRIAAGFLTPEARALVESAIDPANDPFGFARRNAPEPEAPVSDEDNLDGDDDDDDDDDGESND